MFSRHIRTFGLVSATLCLAGCSEILGFESRESRDSGTLVDSAGVDGSLDTVLSDSGDSSVNDSAKAEVSPDTAVDVSIDTALSDVGDSAVSDSATAEVSPDTSVVIPDTPPGLINCTEAVEVAVTNRVSKLIGFLRGDPSTVAPQVVLVWADSVEPTMVMSRGFDATKPFDPKVIPFRHRMDPATTQIGRGYGTLSTATTINPVSALDKNWMQAVMGVAGLEYKVTPTALDGLGEFLAGPSVAEDSSLYAKSYVASVKVRKSTAEVISRNALTTGFDFDTDTTAAYGAHNASQVVWWQADKSGKWSLVRLTSSLNKRFSLPFGAKPASIRPLAVRGDIKAEITFADSSGRWNYAQCDITLGSCEITPLEAVPFGLDTRSDLGTRNRTVVSTTTMSAAAGNHRVHFFSDLGKYLGNYVLPPAESVPVGATLALALDDVHVITAFIRNGSLFVGTYTCK